MIVKVTESNKSFTIRNKYCLKYQLGEITESMPDTLGIFCFHVDPKKRYIPLLWPSISPLQVDIYEVEGIEELPNKIRICNFFDDFSFDKFYSVKGDLSLLRKISTAPINENNNYIRCYRAVRLLKKLDKRSFEYFNHREDS